MSWGMEMSEIRSEALAREKAREAGGKTVDIRIPTAEETRLQGEKMELRGALERLLAKPRCGACRRAAWAVLDRIKIERVG